MGDFGEKRNAEGYYDPTPYQAIRNMIKPGEIWTFQKRDNVETEVFVVAFSDNVATILFLMDECKVGCVECGASRYVNPRMMNWAWGGYLSKRVRKLTDEEFDRVLGDIEDALEIQIPIKKVEPDPAASHEVEAMKHEIDALRCRYKEADSMANEYADRYKEEKAKADTYKIQLDMMKSMYSDLMEKFLQRA